MGTMRGRRNEKQSWDWSTIQILDNITVKAFFPYINSCFNLIKSQDFVRASKLILKCSKELKQTLVSNSIHENQTTEKGSEQRSTASRHKFTVTSV